MDVEDEICLTKVPVAELVSETPQSKRSGLAALYTCVYCVLLMLGMMHHAHKNQIFRN